MRYDLPVTIGPAKSTADQFVLYATLKLIGTPVGAILSGTLWGPEAFIGGAIIVATVLFVTDYFEDEIDAL